MRYWRRAIRGATFGAAADVQAAEGPLLREPVAAIAGRIGRDDSFRRWRAPDPIRAAIDAEREESTARPGGPRGRLRPCRPHGRRAALRARTDRDGARRSRRGRALAARATAPAPMIVFENVTKVYPRRRVGLRDVSLHDRQGRVGVPRRPVRLGQVDDDQAAAARRSTPTERQRHRRRPLAVEAAPLASVPQLRRNIGCVFQDFKLLPNRNVFENVAYALEVQGERRDEDRAQGARDPRTSSASARRSSSFPNELSGGEQQRVSIARAFVNHPPLLICDEPTGNLDPDTSVGIMQLLYRINRTGTTVVMATHDREMVDKMRRRVIALEDGRLVRDDRRGGYIERDSSGCGSSSARRCVAARTTSRRPSPRRDGADRDVLARRRASRSARTCTRTPTRCAERRTIRSG